MDARKRKPRSGKLCVSCFGYTNTIVSITPTAEPFFKTAPRVRAQNHRCGLSAMLRPKSNGQANLRGATYDESFQLESCSRDPIGYEGSKWNLFEYVASEPLNAVDPEGTLMIIPLGLMPGSCGGTATSPVRYVLDNPNPRNGFLVQQVTYCRVENTCDPCCIEECDPTLSLKDCVTYYEVIPGDAPVGQYSNVSVKDKFEAGIPGETCGMVFMFGEVRYYAASVTGPLKKSTGTGPIHTPRGGTTISSGWFPGSRNKPHFWDTKFPDEGPVFHRMLVGWNCCCGIENVATSRSIVTNGPKLVLPIQGTGAP